MQVPTSAIPKEGDVTSHMHLTFYSNINSVVGAYKHPILASVGSKTYQQMYSLPLTCKAIPFIYKRGCAPSNITQFSSVDSRSYKSFQIHQINLVHSLTTKEPLGSNFKHTLEHLAHSGAPVALGPSDRSQPDLLYTPSFSFSFVTPLQTSSTWARD